MKKSNLVRVNSAVFGFSILLASGCSSIQKAPIDSNADAREEVSKLNSSIQDGYAGQYDILAMDDFVKAEKFSMRANERLKEGDDRADIIDEVSFGRSYFERAKRTADANSPAIAGILKARSAALSTSIRHTDQEKELAKIDDDVRSFSRNFEKKMDLDDAAKLEKRYYDLELTAIQKKELSLAWDYLQSAEKMGAKELAPMTYKQAQNEFRDAENVIASDRHDYWSHVKSIERANDSAKNLYDVTSKINNSSSKMSEDAAVQLVAQENEIRNQRIANEGLSRSLSSKEQALGEKEIALAKLKMKEQRQEAITKAQDEFTADEAEVYQQGDQVLIRLKKINFPSGSAKIPAESKSLLSKVLRSIKRLDAAEIKVEGHTDASGNANQNMKLSQKRADEIADYLRTKSDRNVAFEAIGQGYEKPIATNKTKAGRAQNRRVDLIITPKSSSM